MWLLDRFLKKNIKSGLLTITAADGSKYSYGSAHDEYGPVHIRLKDKATASRISRNPAIAAGEAYMDGGIIIENDDIFGLKRSP